MNTIFTKWPVQIISKNLILWSIPTQKLPLWNLTCSVRLKQRNFLNGVFVNTVIRIFSKQSHDCWKMSVRAKNSHDHCSVHCISQYFNCWHDNFCLAVLRQWAINKTIYSDWRITTKNTSTMKQHKTQEDITFNTSNITNLMYDMQNEIISLMLDIAIH